MATSNGPDITNTLGNLQRADKDDKEKDLIIMDNGKFKWRGDLTTLQLFLDEVLNIKGKWTTASGAKTLRTDTTTIRWYSHNNSLTISGTDAEKVRHSLELRATAYYSTETSEIDSTIKSKHLENHEGEASESNINEGESSGSLNNIVQGLNIELMEFKCKFDTYRAKTNKAIQNLQDESLKGLCNDKENENNNLCEENNELKRKNQDLSKRINYLENKLADLNGKIMKADEEKASLITAIRLLQSDVDNNSVQITHERTGWIKADSKGDNRKIRNQHTNNERSQPQNNQSTKDTLRSNQYSPLEIEEPQSPIDVSSDNCSDNEESNGQAASAKKPQRNKKINRKVARAKKPKDPTHKHKSESTQTTN